MPKIFALRDRLQAVQDYLIDTEDELQIFPGKQFPQTPPKKDLKCPLPLGERDLNVSLVDENIGVSEEKLIPDEDPFDIDHIGHQIEVFAPRENLYNQSHEILTNDSIITPSKDTSKVLISDEYRETSAIETSMNEKELPEESQENTKKRVIGKSQFQE